MHTTDIARSPVEERTAPVGVFMSKDGHAYYPAGPALTAAADAEYAKIAAADFLRGIGKARFVAELAERWGELNVIHSFREGNTRAQFVFFSQLSEQAGYQLAPAQFAPSAPLRDKFIAARFRSQDTGRNDELARVLSLAVVPLRTALDGDASDAQLRSTRRARRPSPGQPFGEHQRDSGLDM